MKTTTILLTFLLIFSFSCSDRNSPRCHETPSQGITLKFDFQGINNLKAAKYWDFDTLRMANVSLSEQDFRSIINGIKISQAPDNLNVVILYLDIDPGKTPVVSSDNILAFSSYTVKDSTMFHNLFMRQDSSDLFSPVRKLSCTVSGIRTKDPSIITRQFIKSAQKPVTWLLMYSDQMTWVKIKSAHQLTDILQKVTLDPKF